MTAVTTPISSATFRAPSSAPSFRFSPPRTAPARSPSPAGGDPSGAPRLSTSKPTTASAPTSSSASPWSPRSSPSTLARPVDSSSTTSACTWTRKGSPKKQLRSTTSRALAGLQYLDISFHMKFLPHIKLHPLPPSVFRCASTLVVARISSCDFPKEIAPSVSFDLLKELILDMVSISEDVFHGVLSSCRVLESLSLEYIAGVGCLRIISPTLRSVRLWVCFTVKGKLVIEDAPHLERLVLPYHGDCTIHVFRAPKLEMLGPLSPSISELEIANLVFESLTPASFKNTISTVKVLALEFVAPNLYAVIDVLRCFPCLEKLYVTHKKFLNKPMEENVHQYDPTDRVKCLEAHLKELVLKNYEGNERDIWFAKFFVLNAEVLKKIKFGVSEKISMEWVADQYRLLEVGTRASPGAQLEFIDSGDKNLDAHELRIPSPDLV